MSSNRKVNAYRHVSAARTLASNVTTSSDASTIGHAMRHDQIVAVILPDPARSIARQRIVDVKADGRREFLANVLADDAGEAGVAGHGRSPQCLPASVPRGGPQRGTGLSRRSASVLHEFGSGIVTIGFRSPGR
ncbi:hypothetical protein [Sorangium sp. So ce861]|uniref:hypothetical protein n=1 Tax=Sorangium sp. So ce861 TaxID=3133323 RepID=UPI003F5D98D9